MGKERLNTKFNIQDPIHTADYDPFHSAFGYKDFSKLSNWVSEYQFIAPDTNNIGFGATIRFQVS